MGIGEYRTEQQIGLMQDSTDSTDSTDGTDRTGLGVSVGGSTQGRKE